MVSTPLKNIGQNGFIFPNFRAENLKKSELPPPRIVQSPHKQPQNNHPGASASAPPLLSTAQKGGLGLQQLHHQSQENKDIFPHRTSHCRGTPEIYRSGFFLCWGNVGKCWEMFGKCWKRWGCFFGWGNVGDVLRKPKSVKFETQALTQR